MTESRRHKKPSTDPRALLEDFLEQFSRAHGTRLENVTADIVGFDVTPALEGLVPDRKKVEFPLIVSQAVDPAAEDSSCRDLARLVDRAMAHGRFCFASCEPLVTAGEAWSNYAAAHPAAVNGGAGSLAAAATVGHRPVAVLNFRVAYRHLQEEVLHPTFVFDLERGAPAQEFEEVLHHLHPWESRPAKLPEDLRACLERAWSVAVEELRRQARARLRDISHWLEQQEQARREVMETYFDELAKELEEERRSVYYHLYFFEKEQEIEDKMKRIEDERQHRGEARTPQVRPEWALDLVNAAVFLVPVTVASPGGGPPVEIELLEGRVARVDDDYRLLS